MAAPARRLLVRSMVEKGLSEQRGITVVGVAASALRYETRPDLNFELREQIAALAQRHRCYGKGTVLLKLRQKGLVGNYKRVEGLYQEAGLQVLRRQPKKVLVGDRQPLLRPFRSQSGMVYGVGDRPHRRRPGDQVLEHR